MPANKAAAQATVLCRRKNSLAATLVAPSLVAALYDTLPGNQPVAFGNVIAIWQGTAVQWGEKPLTMQAIIKNDQEGDQVVPFSATQPPYTVAYGTSASGTAYCATVLITAIGMPGSPFASGLDLTFVGNDSLVASFSTPEGNQPHAYENWLGLWDGKVATYDRSNQIKRVSIDPNVSSDYQFMNDLTLTIDTVYTLGYGCGPKDTDLAATLTFKTESFLLSLRKFLQKNDLQSTKTRQLLRKLLQREE